MKIKQLLIISILTLSIQNIQSQIRNRLSENDWKRYNLNGKVHIVEYREYESLQNIDSSFSFKLNFEIFMNSHFDFVFSQKGYLSKKNEFYAKKDSLVIAAIWSYKYDEKDRILKEQKISYKYPDTAIWKHTFPDKNTVLIENTSRMIGKIFYKYIQDGEKEELTTRRPDTSFKRNEMLYYDKKNRMYKNETYFQDTIYSSQEYNYQNSKSNNISNQRYIYKGKSFLFESRLYDKNNNIIAIYNEEKRIQQSFEYIYDKKKTIG